MSAHAGLLKLQKLQSRAAHILTYSTTLISVISSTPRMENAILSEGKLKEQPMAFKSLQGLAPAWVSLLEIYLSRIWLFEKFFE